MKFWANLLSWFFASPAMALSCSTSCLAVIEIFETKSPLRSSESLDSLPKYASEEMAAEP